MRAECIDTWSELFALPSSSTALCHSRPRRVPVLLVVDALSWRRRRLSGDTTTTSSSSPSSSSSSCLVGVAKSNRSLPRWKEIVELRARWSGRKPFDTVVSSSSTRVLPLPHVSSRRIAYVYRATVTSSSARGDQVPYFLRVSER